MALRHDARGFAARHSAVSRVRLENRQVFAALEALDSRRLNARELEKLVAEVVQAAVQAAVEVTAEYLDTKGVVPMKEIEKYVQEQIQRRR